MLVRALDESLGLQPVLNQLGDREDAEPVLLREHLEVRHAGHRSILVHDLADDARGHEPREPREIDRAFGLPGAHEDAAVSRAQREHVAGGDEVLGLHVRIARDARRVGAIGRADPGRHAVARFDADRERRAERRAAAPGSLHHREAELVDLRFGERDADEAAPVHGHEVDGLGRDVLGRHREIAFVLAILVVDEDHHLAGADVGERGVHPREERGLDVERGGHLRSLQSTSKSQANPARFRVLMREASEDVAPGSVCRRRAT